MKYLYKIQNLPWRYSIIPIVYSSPHFQMILYSPHLKIYTMSNKKHFKILFFDKYNYSFTFHNCADVSIIGIFIVCKLAISWAMYLTK